MITIRYKDSNKCNVKLLLLFNIYRYTKLRMFALKLKKKLIETIALLQSAEQDKAKLENMLAINGQTDNKGKPTSDVDTTDNRVGSGDASEVLELQTKLNSLTEVSEKMFTELENVKGKFIILNSKQSFTGIKDYYALRIMTSHVCLEGKKFIKVYLLFHYCK